MTHTPSTVTLQDLSEDFLPMDLLPEDIIADPFDVLSPADEIWNGRPRESFDANMSRAGIFHCFSTGKIGAVEAFRALEAYELVDYDTLMDVLMIHHRTVQIIEGAK